MDLKEVCFKVCVRIIWFKMGPKCGTL